MALLDPASVPVSSPIPSSASSPVSHRYRQRRPGASLWSALAVLTLWSAMLLTVPHVAAGATVRPFALFAHLASLILGFGAVLTLDWFGLMWLLGRQRLTDLVRAAQMMHLPIWAGLTGLTVSGVLLSPDISAPLTDVKMAAVLAVALNGLAAPRVQERLVALGDRKPSLRLLGVAMLVATISQGGWWTATIVGFLNAQH
jgi:hypothetical protein